MLIAALVAMTLKRRHECCCYDHGGNNSLQQTRRDFTLAANFTVHITKRETKQEKMHKSSTLKLKRNTTILNAIDTGQDVLRSL